MFLPALVCAVGAELSYLGFGWKGNSSTLNKVQQFYFEQTPKMFYQYYYYNYSQYHTCY